MCDSPAQMRQRIQALLVQALRGSAPGVGLLPRVEAGHPEVVGFAVRTLVLRVAVRMAGRDAEMEALQQPYLHPGRLAHPRCQDPPVKAPPRRRRLGSSEATPNGAAQGRSGVATVSAGTAPDGG